MAYCTVEEVFAMFKEDALNTLAGTDYIEDPEERRKVLTPYVVSANEDADAEINGYLNKRYEVPFRTVPKVICKYSKDIAVYNLASRSGIDEGEREKTILNRYNAAIRFLENVAKGIVEIGEGAKGENPADKQAGFAVRSQERIFTRSSMKGW